VTERRPISAEVYVGERRIGTATDVEVDFGVERRAPSAATGTMERLSEWKVYAPTPLPPWTPEHREQVRRDLKAHPMVEVTFGPYPSPDGVVGTVTRVVDPQPTVLREERMARAANIRHYCRKCCKLGTKRHHAMCPKRGRPT
jgi:hypothetical protein